ncbi:MAG: zinc-binding dehydrogenase [Planctomycetaceae bacterium]|nr:zinc-binding dehydrogenase [Planctomycetaceae bacterium]
MTEFCRAAVFVAAGSPLELRTLPLPKLLPHQVLVQVTCCTICGSDLHSFTGARSSPTPGVLGHEIIGRIERLPAGGISDVCGQSLRAGDRVTWSVAASCGQCDRCERRMPQKCDSLFKYGHERFANGTELSGGLADYCVLHSGTAIMKLPDDLPDRIACPASCATATVAAAVRNAGALAGRRVLVMGAGMLGLTACAFARAADAASVCLCDPVEARRVLGLKFGATEAVAAIDSEDFDCVFEMSGNAFAVEAAIRAATVGGRIVLVGSVSPSQPVAVDPERVVRRLLTICGVHNYLPEDLVTAVKFLQANHASCPFEELVERSWPLSDVNAAFEYAVQERPIRVAVLPDSTAQ